MDIEILRDCRYSGVDYKSGLYKSALGNAYSSTVAQMLVDAGAAKSLDYVAPEELVKVATKAIAPKISADLGIAGQSTEQGACSELDAYNTWQSCQMVSPRQGIVEPCYPNIWGAGSWFTVAADMLADDGIHVNLYNGAIGSSSWMDWTGSVLNGGRANSTAYRGRRAANTATQDLGHKGQCINANGAVWEAIVGNTHLVNRQSTTPMTVGGTTVYNYNSTILKDTNILTGAAAPTFPASPTIETVRGALDGTTVVDGGITWMAVRAAVESVVDGNEIPIVASRPYFDPYFLCDRLYRAVAFGSSSNKFVYLQNGQSDSGKSTLLYTRLLTWLLGYFATSKYGVNIIPIIGLSCKHPAGSATSYNLMEVALSNSNRGQPTDYANSPLTTQILAYGYHLGTPGIARPSFPFYYGASLWREMPDDMTPYIGQAGVHPNKAGVFLGASKIAPMLSKIIRNSAT